MKEEKVPLLIARARITGLVHGVVMEHLVTMFRSLAVRVLYLSVMLFME